MSGRFPDWAVEGADWPNREASQFVAADGHNFHVQRMGAGPSCLLLHGTGAATHSWRDVMPLLARQFDVVAVDLPGHGFTRTQTPRPVTLAGMAAAMGALLDTLAVRPDVVVGHSAGAAIGAQLVLDQQWPAPLIGLMPALMPFPGLAARLFPSLARVMFTNPFVGVILSRLAAYPGETARFLRRATGSQIDAVGEICYRRLFSTSGHCDGAVRMMANWRLEPLRDRLPLLTAPTLLVHAGQDRAIPTSSVLAAATLIPGCSVQEMARLGHLAHEEDPAGAASIISTFAKDHGAA